MTNIQRKHLSSFVAACLTIILVGFGFDYFYFQHKTPTTTSSNANCGWTFDRIIFNFSSGKKDFYSIVVHAPNKFVPGLDDSDYINIDSPTSTPAEIAEAIKKACAEKRKNDAYWDAESKKQEQQAKEVNNLLK